MESQPAASPAIGQPERPGLRALIVEDSRVDAAVLIQLLRAGGWQVTQERVDKPETFLQALTQRPWDVILCDHTMPGFSAPEALELLQGTGLDIPFLIISGGIQEGVAIQAMKSGASDFIMKGSLGRLVPAVDRELRDAASRRARRQAEATLKESELRYRSVWENSTDAVVLLDLEGIIRFANPAVSRVFGWDPSEVGGKTLDLFQPEDLPQHSWWQRVSATSGSIPYTAVARRSNGSAVEVDLAATPMRMGDQQWIVAFFRDVTERRRAERELQRSREEFAAAREIQQRLFPRSFPTLPGFDLAGISHPAESAGGDYFDFLPMQDGGLGLVVADVSGHGVGPALLMAETRAYLRPLARRHALPGEMLTIAHELLVEDLGDERYITVLVVRLNPSERTLTFANAGHPPGLLLDREGQIKARLKRTGRPFGKQGKNPYPTGESIALSSGDILLMLTDGIDEAMRPDGECFGLDRAAEVLKQNRTRSARELVETLCQAARDFAAPEPQADDLTVLIVKVL